VQHDLADAVDAAVDAVARLQRADTFGRPVKSGRPACRW
jgi:hypothetical protein